MAKRPPQHGFTLMEALIASVVLSVAVVAISTAVTAGHMQNGYALHAQRANRLAEELLEYICSLSYSDPHDGSLIGKGSGEIRVFCTTTSGTGSLTPTARAG